MLSIGGCASKPMYDGPVRPAAETATIESANTFVIMIDGRETNPMGNGDTFTVLPGDHTLAVKLNDSVSGDVMRRTSHKARDITFSAKAGHTYRTFPYYPNNYKGGYWQVAIMDKSTQIVVATEDKHL